MTKEKAQAVQEFMIKRNKGCIFKATYILIELVLDEVEE